VPAGRGERGIVGVRALHGVEDVGLQPGLGGRVERAGRQAGAERRRERRQRDPDDVRPRARPRVGGDQHIDPLLRRDDDVRSGGPRRQHPGDGAPVRRELDAHGPAGSGVQLVHQQVRGLRDPVEQHLAGELDALGVGPVPGEAWPAGVVEEAGEQPGNVARFAHEMPA
jgi:hypothetical protein